jgi:hypothetical protein
MFFTTLLIGVVVENSLRDCEAGGALGIATGRGAWTKGTLRPEWCSGNRVAEGQIGRIGVAVQVGGRADFSDLGIHRFGYIGAAPTHVPGARGKV